MDKEKNKKFKAKKNKDHNRRENNREKYNVEKIVFSFKYFVESPLKPSFQSFKSWEKDKILSNFIEKLKFLTNMTIKEAEKGNFITIYQELSPKCHFKKEVQKIEENYKETNKIKWTSIKKLSGKEGKARVIGFFEENIFNIVFLDKDHLFYPSKLRNT